MTNSSSNNIIPEPSPASPQQKIIELPDTLETASLIMALKERNLLMEEQIGALTGEIVIYEKENATLENKLESYSRPVIEEKIYELSEKLASKESLIVEMNLAQESLRKELGTTRNQSAFLTDTIDVLQKTTDDKEFAFRHEIDSLKRLIVSFEKSIILKGQELLLNDKQSLDKEQLLKLVIEEKSDIIANIEIDIKEREKQLQTNEKLKSRLDDERSINKQDKLMLSAIAAKYEALAEQLTKVNVERIKLQKSIEEEMILRYKAEESIKTLQKDSSSEKQLLADARIENEKLGEQYRELSKTLESYKEKLTEETQLRKKLELFLNENNEKLNKTKQLLSTIMNIREEEKLLLKDTEVRLKTTKVQYNELTGTLNNLTNNYKGLQNSLNIELQRRESLEKDLAETHHNEKILTQQIGLLREEKLLLSEQVTKTELQESLSQEETTETKFRIIDDSGKFSAFNDDDANMGNVIRIHLVAENETITGISSLYYGTSRYWREIYDANKDVIDNKDSIRTGTALVIP